MLDSAWPQGPAKGSYTGRAEGGGGSGKCRPMSSSTHFSPKPEEADRGARTSRPTEGTRISLVLTMDKDKRPLHLVRSTGPRGTAQKEGRQAAWHCGRGVAFGESHPLHSFVWPVGTAIIPVPKRGAERITRENQDSAERGRWRCSHSRRGGHCGRDASTWHPRAPRRGLALC